MRINNTGIGFMPLAQVLAATTLSKSGFYAGVKRGIYPAPVRISAGRVAWRVTDINALIARMERCDVPTTPKAAKVAAPTPQGRKASARHGD